MQTTEETVRHFIRELRVPDCCTFSLKVLVNFHLTFNDHFITAHALRCAKAAYGNDQFYFRASGDGSHQKHSKTSLRGNGNCSNSFEQQIRAKCITISKFTKQSKRYKFVRTTRNIHRATTRVKINSIVYLFLIDKQYASLSVYLNATRK